MHLQLVFFCNDDFLNSKIQNFKNPRIWNPYTVYENAVNVCEKMFNKYSIHDNTTIVLEKTLKLCLQVIDITKNDRNKFAIKLTEKCVCILNVT